MPWITVDTRSAVLGQAAFDLGGAIDKAQEPLPDGKSWGLARIRVVGTLAVNVVAATLAGAITGKRLYEYLQNIQVALAGYKRNAFDCSGRFLRFRAAEIRGKLANADPATVADADQTPLAGQRLIYILDFQDERLGAFKNDPVPHLSALRSVIFNLQEIGIAGITFASMSLTLELELIPINALDVPVPQTAVIEANGGSGSVNDTRMVVTPRPDALMALTLAYQGNVSSGALENAQVDEACQINMLDLEGKNQIRLQTARSQLERHNASVPFDAALDESTTAPLVLPLIFPEGPTDAAHLPQCRGGGFVEFATSPSDSGNASTAIPKLWIDGYNGVDNKSDHEDSYAMEALGIPRGTPVAIASKAKGRVPSARVASLIPRSIRPLK